MQEVPWQILRGIRVALAVAAATAGGHAARAADEPPAATVRLGDLFEGRGGKPATARQQPGTRLGRSTIIVPDTSTWMLPPETPVTTDEPTLLEGMSDIPRIPLLIAARDRHDRQSSAPALRSEGRTPAAARIPVGYALIRLENRFEQLRAEIRLIPIAEPGAPPREPLTILQAPGTVDEFAVPEGLWRVERELWAGDDGGARAREIYPEQRLVSRTGWRFEESGGNEATILRRDLHFGEK